MKLFLYILTIFPYLTFAQTDIKNRIDSLKFVSEIPYACEIIKTDNSLIKTDSFAYSIGCGDSLFWSTVQLKDQAIPLLIEQLDNLNETLASFPYQGGQCKVSDVAYIALEEIIHGIPTAALLNVNPTDYDCGYCYYHLTLSKKGNRLKFKKAVYDWYRDNKEKMIWISDNKYATCDCSGKHPSGGHYQIEK